jgi:GH15 family glucan-1,4-alpha-glucosidase
MEPNLDLAVVGNCAWGGLVDCRGRLVWACLPRFDSDPVFAALLDSGGGDHDGAFAVELLDFAECEQRYEGNTPILVTTLRDRSDSAVEARFRAALREPRSHLPPHDADPQRPPAPR